MATRKFKLNALRKKLAEIQALIDESDAALEGASPDVDAQDNPPAFQGMPQAPNAMDAAPTLDTRPWQKGLAYTPHTSAYAALEKQIPNLGRLRNRF